MNKPIKWFKLNYVLKLTMLMPMLILPAMMDFCEKKMGKNHLPTDWSANHLLEGI
jgi:hypothetical protein